MKAMIADKEWVLGGCEGLQFMMGACIVGQQATRGSKQLQAAGDLGQQGLRCRSQWGKSRQ